MIPEHDVIILDFTATVTANFEYYFVHSLFERENDDHLNVVHVYVLFRFLISFWTNTIIIINNNIM